MSTTTTSNYGWTIPNNDELVKDGAAAIRTLGNAADSSLKTVSDGRGLIHINTTTFTSVASQSISDVFSTTYNNYRIVLNDLQSTTDGDDIGIRLRVSGTDNSSNNYYSGRMYVGAYASQTFGSGNNNLGSQFSIVQTTSSAKNSGALDLYSPFLTSNTAYNGFGAGKLSDYYSGVMTVTTSYTGFTIRGAGTISGTVSVYGYKK